MWTAETRALVGDFGAGRALSDEQYALLVPLIPPAKPGGRPRTGPPPEEWRGGIRTSRGRAHVDPFHAGPRLGRGAVAQARVQALPVVEDLDVIEHRRPGFRAGAEMDVVDVLLLERGEEALHGRVDAPIEVKRRFALERPSQGC